MRKRFPWRVGMFKNTLDRRVLEGPFKGPEEKGTKGLPLDHDFPEEPQTCMEVDATVHPKALPAR